ncbi:MAG: hypothetical protein JSU67_02810 [Gammaproteobacteria bacterium]|nr:MAG: hypothetical protein EP300_05935 [Gammaproteobacteria bacterium]UCH40646.1 MAG: hypothetical protein JSU67_02810 [Gammaproteobacteria bacterium]
MLSHQHSAGRLASILLFVFTLVLLTTASPIAFAAGDGQTIFKQVPTQYIAALGEPNASSGNNAQDWGLWRVDPGPRGVRLKHYEQLEAAGGVAPAQWLFDSSDWWLEENGLIMEAPEFPLLPGKYIVTGDRETITMLTVHAADANGNQRWELDDGATLHDVTHLGCRSARYTPASNETACSPAQAPQSAFRVSAGDPMPPVEGCNKQDYAVLFIIAVATDS